MRLRIRLSLSLLVKLVVICLWVGGVGSLQGCGPKGQVAIQLIPAKQDFREVVTLSFRFFGDALQKTPEPFTVPAEEGAATLPPLVLDQKATDKQIQGQVLGLDDAGKVIAFGASHLNPNGAQEPLKLFFTRTKQFTKLISFDEQNQDLNISTSGLIGHNVVALKDGRLLISGGVRKAIDQQGWMGVKPSDFRKEMILYDPRTGNVTSGSSFQLANARAFHTTTVLSDGRVLVAGGFGVNNGAVVALSSTEVFDFSSKTPQSSVGPFLAKARACHTATLLEDGTVLFVGGLDTPLYGLSEKKRVAHQLRLVEAVIPNDRKLKGKDILTLPPEQARFFHKATAIGSTSIMVVGGMAIDAAGQRVVNQKPLWLYKRGEKWIWKAKKGAERYDHALVGVSVGNARFAVALGGRDAKNQPVKAIDVWNIRGDLSSGGRLRTGRYGLFAVAMENQTLLVGGGVNANHKPVSTSELFSISLTSQSKLKLVLEATQPALVTKGRYRAVALSLAFDPRVYVVGGGTVSGTQPKTELLLTGSRTIELYTPLPRVSSGDK